MEILHSRLRLNRKIFASFNVIDFQLFLSLDDGEWPVWARRLLRYYY
jgi:hypothetical protein